jgi:hypothetical protein
MNDLDRMLIERACERLVYEYSRRIDLGEAERIADLFIEDAVWCGDIVLEGREAIRAWFTQRGQLTRRVSRHVCTNVLIDVLSEDEATGLSYLVNYRHDRAEGDDQLPVPANHPKYMGELRDTFRRTDAGWLFARREVDVAFLRARGTGAPDSSRAPERS